MRCIGRMSEVEGAVDFCMARLLNLQVTIRVTCLPKEAGWLSAMAKD